MKSAKSSDQRSPIEMSAAEFRAAGHRLVDRIAKFLESLPARPIARGKLARTVRELIGQGGLPTKRNTGRERPPVEAMVGMERSILAAIAEDEFHLVALSRVARQ